MRSSSELSIAVIRLAERGQARGCWEPGDKRGSGLRGDTAQIYAGSIRFLLQLRSTHERPRMWQLGQRLRTTSDFGGSTLYVAKGKHAWKVPSGRAERRTISDLVAVTTETEQTTARATGCWQSVLQPSSSSRRGGPRRHRGAIELRHVPIGLDWCRQGIHTRLQVGGDPFARTTCPANRLLSRGATSRVRVVLPEPRRTAWVPAQANSAVTKKIRCCIVALRVAYAQFRDSQCARIDFRHSAERSVMA